MKNATSVLVLMLAVLCLNLSNAASVRPIIQVGTTTKLTTQINLTSRQPDIVVTAGPVSGRGDFNGDGVDDLLESVTPPLLDMTGGGIIFGGKNIDSSSGTISFGRPDLFIAPKSFSFTMPRFVGITSLNDLNGDGIDEIAAHVINVNAPDGRMAQAEYVYFGSPSLVPGEIDLREWTPDLKLFNTSSGNLRILFSFLIADINGDGANDLISTGVLLAQGLNLIHIVLGPFASGSVIDLQTRAPDIVIITGNTSGFSGMMAADVNGDGISDLLIGRPVDRRVDIVAGSTELRAGTEISLVQGGASTVIDGLPGRVPTLATGDVNGDGVDDILIGNPTRVVADGSTDVEFPGEVYVVFGSSSLTGRRVSISDGQQDVTIRGAAGGSGSSFQGDSFGLQVFPLDLNGDGISDILVQALFGEGPRNRFRDSGAAYVILGSRGLKSGTTFDVGRDEQDVKMFIEEKDAHLNLAIGGTFDINGDGYSDIGFTINRPRIPPPPPDSFYFDPLNVILGGPVAPPEVTKAKFQSDSSELIISGENFNGAMQVEINGVLLDRKASYEPSTGRLRVEGKKGQLNLHSGKNELTVVRRGSRSNTVKVKA